MDAKLNNSIKVFLAVLAILVALPASASTLYYLGDRFTNISNRNHTQDDLSQTEISQIARNYFILKVPFDTSIPNNFTGNLDANMSGVSLSIGGPDSRLTHWFFIEGTDPSPECPTCHELIIDPISLSFENGNVTGWFISGQSDDDIGGGSAIFSISPNGDSADLTLGDLLVSNNSPGIWLRQIPLPATLPLMLSGLGVLGFASRRKKNATVFIKVRY